jgi:hypothetical protein
MKDNSSFYQSAALFTSVCEELYLKNILTLDALRESTDDYHRFFLATYNFMEAMAGSPVYSDTVKKLGAQENKEKIDYIHDLTIHLVENKYRNIMKAIQQRPENHNLKSYVSSIVSSYLNDLRNKIYKQNVLKFRSIYEPLSEDGTILLGDQLESCFPTPEETCMTDYEENVEAREFILHVLSLSAQHKTRGETLSLLLYGRKAENAAIKIRTLAKRLCQLPPSSRAQYLMRLYNHLLVSYNNIVLHLNARELSLFYSTSPDDFGDISDKDAKKLELKLSHWNSLLACEVRAYAEEQGIKIR